MGWAQAQAHLDALGVDAMKSTAPSLHRMEALCRALDHPERAVPSIHVTGTNGKTSTARLTAAVLGATGLKVGTYTSPHLQTMRERIALGGRPITEDDFGEGFDHLAPFLELVEGELEERLTFFEVLTALYFSWAAENADVSVVEVGLGGRWDATNVMDASVAVITNVGLDHTGLLGSDRATIAREKSGIIKPAVTVVTGERAPQILGVLAEEAAAVEARVMALSRDFEVLEDRVAVGGRYLSVRTSARSYEGLFLPLHGSHQAVNAAVALEAATSFFAHGSLANEVVAEGLAAASVPGRLEVIPVSESPATVLFDVAHNPGGTSALIGGLLETFVFERIVFVVGILADKDYSGMLRELARVDCQIIATRAGGVRVVEPAELVRAATALGLPCESRDGVAGALEAALARAGEADMVCVTGSHYVVGEARDILVGPPPND